MMKYTQHSFVLCSNHVYGTLKVSLFDQLKFFLLQEYLHAKPSCKTSCTDSETTSDNFLVNIDWHICFLDA